MALEVGIDSYVSLEEAETIAVKYFTSTSNERTAWSAISDADKEAMLRHSCRCINNLRFNGRREKIGQRLEFPRVRDAMLCGVAFRPFVSQVYDNSLEDGAGWGNGLEQAKQAQVVNALYHAGLSDSIADRNIMNITGLIAEKTGPAMNKYAQPGKNTYERDTAIGIYSKEVYAILTPWVSTARGGI